VAMSANFAGHALCVTSTSNCFLHFRVRDFPVRAGLAFSLGMTGENAWARGQEYKYSS